MQDKLQQFFDAVLPSQGLLCLVGLRHDRSAGPIVKYFDMGAEGAYTLIKELDADGREVYFGCASYVDSERTKDVRNVQAIKSFYIDIDCGKDGCYGTKQEALQELIRFCTETQLPTPTLVDSGFGVHAYWSMLHSIDYNTWKPIANALKKKAAEMQLKIDPVVTADGARILRVPLTLNKKRVDNHKPVRLRHIAEPMDLETFKARIGYLDLGVAQNFDKDPVMEALLKNSKSYKFSRIHRKNLEEIVTTENVEEEYTQPDGSKALRLVKKKITKIAGCPQLAYCVANRATLKEGMWKAALAVAWFCTDKAEAIEAVSKDYVGPNGEEYSFEDAYYHASRWNTPRTCEGFRACEMPQLCTGCIHNGKIHTPIVLGAVIEEATPEDNVVEVMHETLGEAKTIVIPDDYPFPYFRPKNGGVAMRIQSSDEPEDEEAIDEKAVCKRDLWVKGRSMDGKTEYLSVAFMLPHDGLREFTAPVSTLYKLETLRELLASKGVHEAANDAKLKLIKGYLSSWHEKWQNSGEATKARTQFGWQDEDSVFVIGNREIDKDGNVSVATLANDVENIARNYVKRGSLVDWQEVANTYGKVGNESRAFSLFASFGAPLYKFIGEGSILMHLTNIASGVGKSTALKLVNSVWGHPSDTMMIEQDTNNAKFHRAGILNNIPASFDELTNMAPDKCSDLSFALSQGRGKNRMHATSNTERLNDTTWSTIFQSSGNNSIYDTLQLHKTSVEGELLRVMEVPMAQDLSLTKAQADRLFSELLPKNYGHAGEIFMSYVVPNKYNVIKRLKELQAEFDVIAGLGSKERFYSACFAAAFTGAEIANRLGIIDIPVEPVMAWAKLLLKDIRKAVAKGGFSNDIRTFHTIVSKYWNEVIGQILTINKGHNAVDDALNNQAALKPVIGALKGRYEVSNHRLYLSAIEFDAWMANNRVPSVQVLNGLRKAGVLVYEGAMNLGKDTVIYRTGSVTVYGFDTIKLEAAVEPV